MAKTCKKCGCYQLSDDAVFCHFCGALEKQLVSVAPVDCLEYNCYVYPRKWCDYCSRSLRLAPSHFGKQDPTELLADRLRQRPAILTDRQQLLLTLEEVFHNNPFDRSLLLSAFDCGIVKKLLAVRHRPLGGIECGSLAFSLMAKVGVCEMMASYCVLCWSIAIGQDCIQVYNAFGDSLRVRLKMGKLIPNFGRVSFILNLSAVASMELSRSGTDTKALKARYLLSGLVPDAAGVVRLGSYPQFCVSNEEYIEWVVLKQSGSRALVISRWGIEYRPMTLENREVTWSSSDLRRWLNKDFLELAFNSDERSQIFTTTVDNSDNPYCDTPGGEQTEDKVFLLSCEEANEYFSSDEDRCLRPTSYLQGKGVQPPVQIGEYWSGKCAWWLRSPGGYANFVSFVSYYGAVCQYGSRCSEFGVVRPAMWVRLHSQT